MLIYTNLEKRLVSMYDLRNKTVAKQVELPNRPHATWCSTPPAPRSASATARTADSCCSRPTEDRSCSHWKICRPPPTCSSTPTRWTSGYSNSRDGTVGLIDSNVQRTYEIPVADEPGQALSSPSRSLDGRYVYVANETTGEVYGVNAFSKVIYKTFEVGASPARPYTTPEGVFL